MLVGKRMTKEPVTTTPDEYLATVMAKMEQGGFRHMPVVQGGKLVGIVVGTYREKWGDDPICYLRVRGGDPEKIAEALKKRGYTILGVHV